MSLYILWKCKIPIIITYQLLAPAFTANFTRNYIPIYGPGTKTKANFSKGSKKDILNPSFKYGDGLIELLKVTFDPVSQTDF